MTAVFKKEVRQYSNSVSGYVFLTIFTLICGYSFTTINVYNQRGDIGVFFNNIITIVMFLIPIITMRLFAEERKSKTDQLLLTSPVSIPAIVLGKYFAALAVSGVGLLMTIPYPVVLMRFGSADFWNIFGTYVGFALVMSSFISICIFISSLTENQTIAAVVSYTVLFGLWLIGLLYPSFSNETLRAIVGHLSLYDKYAEFSIGIFNPASAIFYLSVNAVAIFLTIRSVDRRRWA